MYTGPTTQTTRNRLQAKIISGSLVLLSGSTIATAINLAYNVAVAHFTGPKGFGNATALYTLLTLISAVTLSFQIVTSKVVAQQKEAGKRDAAYRDLQRAAWASGAVIASLMVGFSHQIAEYLYLPGASMVVVLAVGAAFYIPLGSRRGYIQGAFGFRSLATNLVLEGAARLAGSLLMILLGFGVIGIIAANSFAMVVSYIAIAPRLASPVSNPLTFRGAFREVSQAMIFFSGQVLINNCDIVLVKHFFPSDEAGLYAAIAMVGRVAFASSSAIVNSMFPIVAGSKKEERKSLSLVGTALGLVLLMGVVLAVGLRVAPGSIWTMLFGSHFQISGQYGFPYLLGLYAITTVVYCLSVVIMTYEMSYKIVNTNWFQLAFSGLLIAGICRYHASLPQVIMVQFVLMIFFLLLIAIPFLLSVLGTEAADNTAQQNIRLIRCIPEDVVISEFLKSDFEHEAYARHREAFRGIVAHPDLEDHAECSKRRALLALRHRALWHELPSDTRWFEAEITAQELPLIRVFPRAQWTRLAFGNFAIKRVAKVLASRRKPSQHDAFAAKIADIRQVISQDNLKTGSVILIGKNEADLLTILDGNHRLVAAVLEGKVESLKFVCGLSPKMSQCCWYKTNLPNLARYGRNLLRHVMQFPKQDILTFCQSSGYTPEDFSPPPVQ
jgi:O-antigen/teichoic acid export membrane protein